MRLDIGTAIEGAMAQHNKERRESATNIRLGELIKRLENLPVKTLHDNTENDRYVITLGAVSVSGFDSYRGYYEDLSLVPSKEGYGMKVSELLERAKEARGKVFTGYKGGNFPMHDDSIIWLAPYGESHGIALVDTIVTDWYFVLVGALIEDD